MVTSFTDRVLRLAMIVTLAAAAWLSTGRLASAQQSDSATIVGTVVDDTKAALPGATVEVTHLATNTRVVVLTNDRGQYRTPPVRIGEYSVNVSLDGFKRYTQPSVTLNIGDVRNVDAILPIGNLTDNVTVTESVPTLNTSDSTVGTVITNQQIQALPLNGRDYLQLASLSAGTGPSTGQGVVIGGQSGTNVAFLLDGQDNNSQQISTGHSGQKEVVKPSVDAIQEFKVVTNGYAAEYGRSSSGVVSVSLKSGTNTLSGSAFEFFRDDRFDSKGYFSQTKPDYNRHQFGGTIGAPVVRNKTFFFGDIERGRIRRESTSVSTLPSALNRTGQFTTTITDPLTGQPFANNQIPANRLDPIAVRILSYVPLPQTDAATRNFTYNNRSDQDVSKWDFKIDQVFSPTQNLYVRGSQQLVDNLPSSSLPPDANGNYVTGGSGDISINRSVAVGYNRVWSPSVISTIKFGWNHINWDEAVPSQELRGVGIPGVDNTQPLFAQTSITGYTGLGISNVPNDDDSTNVQVSGDISWLKGAHNLKAGIQAFQLRTDFLSSQRSSGILSFNGQYSGNALADFLLGYASSASLSKYAKLNFRTPYTHFFFQDDWRASRRLTFNLGLRYELNPPPVDANDAIANFDLDTDPANPRIVLAGEGGRDRASRALQQVNYGLVAPRAGFAYSFPGDKTVLRGGAGVFYGNMITVGGMSSLEINPPNHLRIAQTTDRNAAPTIILSKGFEGALVPSSAKDVNLISYDRRNRVPTSYQANINLQRELPGAVVVEAGYTYNSLVNDWRSIDANPAPAGPGNINTRRRYQTTVVPTTDDVITLSNITRIQKDGLTKYHALQTRVEKRYSKGISLLASYSLSRARGFGGGYQDYNNFAAEVGPSSTDRRHLFVASGVYELPFGNNKTIGRDWGGLTNAVLGGWSFSPILTLVSGSPLDLSVNGNPSNSNGSDRPNVVGDWHVDHPTADKWFNTAAFAANPQYTFGDAPKNLLIGPGSKNLDLALTKSFRVSSRVRADLRIESFNAPNWVNFGNPNTQVGNANFGTISSAGSARNNQVAVKIAF